MKKLLPLIFFAEAFFILWVLNGLDTLTSDSPYLLARIIQYAVRAVLFFLPAWIANGPPALVQGYNILNYPLDLGKTWKDGKRILGDNKTIRGFLAGTLAGGFMGFLQGRILIGFILGFSGMLGDAVKSFFKRRTDIPPGGRFSPWDRIDFILGSLLMYTLIFGFEWQVVAYAFVIMILVYPIHEVSDRIAVFLGIKKNPW